MPVSIIVGAQWGDEGKGKIVDLLSDEIDIVARYQGGANAGHTVVIPTKTPNGITAKDGGEIDHIELFGPPADPANHARNFVLCPGKAYDRSPCGTGTSAKLACLYDDGKLAPGEVWRQESVLGSVFEGSVRIVDGAVRPRIRGTAHIMAEATLLVDAADPFGKGIRA